MKTAALDSFGKTTQQKMPTVNCRKTNTVVEKIASRTALYRLNMNHMFPFDICKKAFAAANVNCFYKKLVSFNVERM